MKLSDLYDILKSPFWKIQAAVLVRDGKAESRGSIEYILKRYSDIEIARISAHDDDIVLYAMDEVEV